MKTLVFEDIDNKISILEEKLKNVKGRDTEVYTRIVGYHRAVTNWNKGKREEYRDRVTFSYNKDKIVEKLANSSDFKENQENKGIDISSGNIAFYKLFLSQMCRNCLPVKEYMKKLPIPGEEVDVSSDLGLNSARKYNVLSTPTVILFDENDHIISTIHTIEELRRVFSKKREAFAV